MDRQRLGGRGLLCRQSLSLKRGGGLERSQNYYDQEKQGAVFIPLLHMVWDFSAVITIAFNANDLTLSQQMLISSNLTTEHTEHHNES